MHPYSTCIVQLAVCTHILQIPLVLRVLYSQYTVIIEQIVKDHVKHKAFMDLFRKFLYGRLAFYTIFLVGIAILLEYLPPPPTQTRNSKAAPSPPQVPYTTVIRPSPNKQLYPEPATSQPLLMSPMCHTNPPPSASCPSLPPMIPVLSPLYLQILPLPPLCPRSQPITTPPRLFRIRRLPSLDFGSEARLTNTSQTLVLPSLRCGSSVGGFGER